jgi:ATP-dependent protease HslVU (ClpYQ) ATPase subunit
LTFASNGYKTKEGNTITVTEETLNKLKQFNVFSDEAMRMIADSEDLKAIYDGFLSDVDLEVDVAKDLKKMLADLQIQEWDREQKNLQDALEGLKSINAQREKEIELIKAKQKLENVKKEKVLRYREGLGFVYEQDTQKVKEAQ